MNKKRLLKEKQEIVWMNGITSSVKKEIQIWKLVLVLVEIERVILLLPHSLERIKVEFLFDRIGDQLSSCVLQVLVASVETWIGFEKKN